MDVLGKGNYTLRRLETTAWADYKTIRLEALQTNPEFFGSNYKKESAYNDDDWISLLGNPACAIFGLYDQEVLIGMTGVILDRDDSSNAILIASFIKEPFRGNGLSKLFYEARITWARQKGCNRITVSHRDGNDASKAANQSFNFKYTHAQDVIWPDGVSAKEYMYVLFL
ncbi:GNAT family N-acetyltransferase [Sphingobacterium sp. N143]|uniref:GNAT family N-acetyltransferase n=1 Tax=Sphingobacterium sp. N143 TaxID=2746727 RepID=UPI00257901C8|nr:GNAT family N-acetyltransferase [Sphingobacterium sp. N143]MDM1296239.1 GNAT family N-acetyltransferase [Sphingobacterium sp. N143]